MKNGTSSNIAAVQTAGGWLDNIRGAILSLVLPGGCRICEQLLTEPTRVPVCNGCLASFHRISGSVCDICGSPLEAASSKDAKPFVCPVCINNENKPYAFDRARSWAFYDGAVAQAIILLKFENIDPLGAVLAGWLAEIVVSGGHSFAADVVVPVPLHRQRERERGYNQASLIAKPLAKMLGLACKSVFFTRTRPRPDKQILTLEERWDSVRGAFATRPGSRIDNQRVLLVDDVMTTGATLDSCAKTLRDAGAVSVVALTVARAMLRNTAGHLR